MTEKFKRFFKKSWQWEHLKQIINGRETRRKLKLWKGGKFSKLFETKNVQKITRKKL